MRTLKKNRNNWALFARFYDKNIAVDTGSLPPQGTLEEAYRAAATFLEKGSASLAVYGLGLGVIYEALRGWLARAPEHHLVFIEDDFAALQMFLNSNRAENILTHPQVSIVVDINDNESTPFLAQLTNDFYFLAFKNNAQKIYAELLSRVYSIHAYLSDLALYKEQANFYYHLTALDEYRSSKGLEGCFTHLPLIVCGAGPSLKEWYLELAKTNAALTAAGTGMNLLNQAGIQADLGIAFDPKLSGLRRMQSNSAFKTPYIVDIDSIGAFYLNGPKVLTWQKTEALWKIRLLDALGIKEQLLMVDPAISSTHYALEVGIKLGFSKQVLVGVDLAYVEGYQYPDKKTWLSDEDPIRKDQIEVRTQDHRIVTVSRTYFKEAVIYSGIALNHPEITYYNASNKGQTIQGMQATRDLTFPKVKKNVQEIILNQPLLNVPLASVRTLLLSWKEELKTSPDLLIGYKKRLELKFEAKKRYLKAMKREKEFEEIEKKMQEFYQKVIDLHSRAVDEALIEVNEKLYFPKQEKQDEIPNNLDGKVKLYYTTGQLKSEIDYVKGKREGLFRYYSRSGQLLEEVHYKRGMPTGKYKQWNRNGEIEKELKIEGVDIETIQKYLKEL